MSLHEIFADAANSMRPAKQPAQPLSTAAEIRIMAAAANCPKMGELLAAECSSIEEARKRLAADLRRLGSAERVEAAAAWRRTIERVNAT